MFVKAIGFHRHRAALRGGYGGSLSSGVPKENPASVLGTVANARHICCIVKAGGCHQQKKCRGTAVGAGGASMPERDPAAGLYFGKCPASPRTLLAAAVEVQAAALGIPVEWTDHRSWVAREWSQGPS